MQAFEETILALVELPLTCDRVYLRVCNRRYADEYNQYQKERRSSSSAASFLSSAALGLTPQTISPATSIVSSRAPSLDGENFTFSRSVLDSVPISIEDTTDVSYEELTEDMEVAWNLEEKIIDRSVKILPGVRRMIDSIPKGRYCVATSGAKTYGGPRLFLIHLEKAIKFVILRMLAYGAMSRVGITPPEVTITADDPRLKAGKPAPDPFLLAAECLGFDAKDCVVFEDSPSGIRAGVASGGKSVFQYIRCTTILRS